MKTPIMASHYLCVSKKEAIYGGVKRVEAGVRLRIVMAAAKAVYEHHGRLAEARRRRGEVVDPMSMYEGKARRRHFCANIKAGARHCGRPITKYCLSSLKIMRFII